MLRTTTLRTLWAALVLICFVACGGPVARVDLAKNPSGRDAQPVEPTVLVASLSGKLGTVEMARCHRTLREAERRGCRVVFRLDNAGSQGEDPAGLQSLLDRLQQSEGTIAVLRGRVTFGAAAIALFCDKVYCLNGAEWGSVVKPEQEVDVLLSEDPESAGNRYLDNLRQMFQARLEARRNRFRPDAERLALAMVDPRVQLVAATVREGGLERARVLDQQELTAVRERGGEVFGETKLTRPLMVTAQMAEEFGLSNGTLQGFDQLADVEVIDRATMGELRENWAEHMVAWLELLQPFLLIAGFLLLLLEVKTPGFALPGLLGCVFLGFALFHSYLVGLAEITEILVFFLGLASIAVEIFLLPGTVVFGIVGFLCLVLSLLLSHQSFVLPSNAIEEEILLWNLLNLVMLFVLVAVLTWLMWRLLPKVPVFNRLMLVPPGPGREPDSNSEPSALGLKYDNLIGLVGRTGRAATVLRPAGVMEIDQDRVDVVTEGEFLEAGVPLRVLYVQGNRVVVARDDAAANREDRSKENGSVGVVVLLCILGLALIFAEVVFVSMGALGIAAAGCLLGAIFVAFQESVAFGIGMAVFEAFAAPAMIFLSFRILPKTPFGRRLILTGPATDGRAAAADHSLDHLLGMQGRTLSALRPAGFARIDGRKVDVVTRGEMLPKDCEVVVLEVSGNRVVVGRVPAGAATGTASSN